VTSCVIPLKPWIPSPAVHIKQCIQPKLGLDLHHTLLMCMFSWWPECQMSVWGHHSGLWISFGYDYASDHAFQLALVFCTRQYKGTDTDIWYCIVPLLLLHASGNVFVCNDCIMCIPAKLWSQSIASYCDCLISLKETLRTGGDLEPQRLRFTL